MATNIADVMAAYKKFLSYQYPRHLQKYQSTEKNDLDAARFEAACYVILRSRDLSIEIGEEDKSGGPDFICTGVSCKFVVEATTVNTFAMENKTGMKHDQTGIAGGFYSKYPTLYQKLISKTKQVAKYEIPKVVSIGSFHNESLNLFRNVMADEYLDVFFIRDSRGRPSPNETLKDISAFTLVGFGREKYSVMGFLNPAPSYYFGIQFLPDICFRQITQQGLIDDTLLGEWVSSSRESQCSFQFPFELLI